MSLSACVPGLCQQAAVYVRGVGLTLTLTYTDREKVAKRAWACVFLHLPASPPSFCFSAFAQFLLESLQICSYSKENRQQASGSTNCTNTTAEKLQQGPPTKTKTMQFLGLGRDSVGWWLTLDRVTVHITLIIISSLYMTTNNKENNKLFISLNIFYSLYKYLLQFIYINIYYNKYI